MNQDEYRRARYVWGEGDIVVDGDEDLTSRSADPDDEEVRVEAAAGHEDIPDEEATRSKLDDGSLRLRGILGEDRRQDVTPGDNNLKHYWTKGEGLKKWLGHPHEWTTLRNHLAEHVGPERAKRIAAEWFHEVKGFWPGSDLHRVEHGKPPRGDRVGPG